MLTNVLTITLTMPVGPTASCLQGDQSHGEESGAECTIVLRSTSVIGPAPWKVPHILSL